MADASSERATTQEWEYEIVEEPNPAALEQRLTKGSCERWEAVNLGYAGECHLLALLKRCARRSRELSFSSAWS